MCAECSKKQHNIIADHVDSWPISPRYRFLLLKCAGYLKD